MTQSIKRLAVGGSAAGFRHFPLSAVYRAAGSGLLSPLYHLVAEQPPDIVRHLFSVRTPRTFSDDLEFFLRIGKPVTLEQVRAHAHGGQRLPPRALFLSFDDGLREVADVIAPMLVRRGVPATFFLNSAFIDNQALFYRHKASLLCRRVDEMPVVQLKSLSEGLAHLGIELAAAESLKRSILSIGYAGRERLDAIAQLLQVDFGHFLREERPYLGSDQIRELLRAGFTIGAHSVDHPRYSTLDHNEQLRQTRQSISFLTERFGVTTRDLAFPFVSDGVSAAFFDAVHGNNDADLLFCLGGIARKDPRNIERVWMETDATTPAENIVRGFYFNRWRSRRNAATRLP